MSSKVPSLDKLKPALRSILKNGDLEALSRKKVRQELEEKFGCSLKPIKEELNSEIDRMLREIQKEQKGGSDEESGSEEESEEESESEEEAPKPKKRGGGGFMKPLMLSPELAKALGVDPSDGMPRPQVVKTMWDYIKAHDLQDPSDKRTIVLDAQMRKVFGRDRFNMFSMNKYLKRHLLSEADLQSQGGWQNVERDGESSEEDEEERAARAAKKRKAKERRAAKKGGKRKKRVMAPNTGFNKLLTLSDELSEFTGQQYMARPQVVKFMWDHIKANGLQNPENKREIFCDDKLKQVLGEEKVTMFSMNKYLKKHFLGPAPESAVKEVAAATAAVAKAASSEEEEEEEEEESEEEEDSE